MNELLKFAVEAHGGIGQWDAFKTIEARMSVGGAIWSYKQKPDLLKQLTFEASTHEERVTLRPFTAPDRRAIFEPSRIMVESDAGDVIESRDAPRAAFADHTAESPWDNLHVAYFSSYALWTYLTSPFLYTYPGFVTEELPVWQENGETWRRLKITFPAHIASHTREQISYFGPDGLLRRHDYTVDILGGASGANYASDYRVFNGITVPMTRRIYAYDEARQKMAEPLLVSIDISDVSFR